MGLYALVLILNALCQRHQLTTGSVTIACDNLQALNVLQPWFVPNVTDSNFDLVNALWSTLKALPIEVLPQHVKGHQDKFGLNHLSRLERLNVEMDSLAKAYWRHITVHDPTAGTPQHLAIAGEGWQLWRGDVKVVRPTTDLLYKMIHEPITQQWWVRHGNLTQASVLDVDWAATEASIKTLPLCRRAWAMKSASDNCGVGTTLVQWKYKTDNKCPRCNAPETTAHVFQCTGEDAQSIWDESLSKLETFMTKTMTDPDISSVILDCLTKWRDRQPIILQSYPTGMHDIIRRQQVIGWKNLLEGLPTKAWQLKQAHYYSQNNIVKSHKRWIKV